MVGCASGRGRVTPQQDTLEIKTGGEPVVVQAPPHLSGKYDDDFGPTVRSCAGFTAHRG